jgi:hypothetical protein
MAADIRETIGRARAVLERGAASYPVLRKLLDGSLRPEDLEQVELAAAAAGAGDVARVLHSMRVDPQALLMGVVNRSGLGRELAELAPLVSDGLDFLQGLDALHQALKK